MCSQLGILSDTGVNTIMTQLDTNKTSRSLPPIGEHVIVQCPNFSCLGYRDAEGRWKNVFTEAELVEVMEFFPIG